jgi:hypothetical protein
MSNIKYKYVGGPKSRPIITKAKWGELVISYNNIDTILKDAIVWNGGVKKWNWSKSNTHHSPGIQLKEIYNFVKYYDSTDFLLILSTGFKNVLQVDQKTIDWLDNKLIDYKILSTYDAIELYNNSKGNVCALIHSTC